MSAKTPPQLAPEHQWKGEKAPYPADQFKRPDEFKSPVAPDSLVARLRAYKCRIGDEAADRIEQQQRERDNAFRAAREHAQASLDSVNRAEAAESRLARITQALTEIVAWANKDSRRGSPDHCHSAPGIWDNDAGNARVGKAGKPCAECAMWDRARDAIRHTTEG